MRNRPIRRPRWSSCARAWRAGGFARMDLTTARTNLPAQALYESLGWRQDQVFLAYNLDLVA